MAADTVILGIIIGTLAAIVYSLRVLILLERRIARMDLNIEALTNRVLEEELVIEREENAIESRFGGEKNVAPKRAAKKPAKKTSKRTSKKASKKTSKKAKSAKKSAKKRKK